MLLRIAVEGKMIFNERFFQKIVFYSKFSPIQGQNSNQIRGMESQGKEREKNKRDIGNLFRNSP